MPEYVTAAIVASSSLLASAIARIRCICRPGQAPCFQSACSDQPLEHADDHEVDLQKVDLYGREVLVVSARS